MIGEIMAQCLQWFSRWIGNDGRVLFMKNFSAHTLAVSHLKQNRPFLDFTVRRLSLNSTPKIQLLDQRIIKASKPSYKRCWIQPCIQRLSPTRILQLICSKQSDGLHQHGAQLQTRLSLIARTG